MHLLCYPFLACITACGLTGTKLVCGEGGCGACTVLLSRLDHSQQKVVHQAVNACLFPLGGVDGCHIITVTHDLISKFSLVDKDLEEYSLETVKTFSQDAQLSGFKIDVLQRRAAS